MKEPLFCVCSSSACAPLLLQAINTQPGLQDFAWGYLLEDLQYLQSTVFSCIPWGTIQAHFMRALLTAHNFSFPLRLFEYPVWNTPEIKRVILSKEREYFNSASRWVPRRPE